MREKKYNYIYEIRCHCNNNIYDGRHSADELDDNYLCSAGKSSRLWLDIAKYGMKNFSRRIVKHCKSFEEVCALETEIVNEEFVKRCDTYNITTGGHWKKAYVNPGDIWIHNPLTNQRLIINPSQIDTYLLEGYERGTGIVVAATQGKIHIHNPDTNHRTLIDPAELDEYNEQGYVRGRNGAGSPKGSIWVYCAATKHRTHIKKNELNDYLSRGYIEGRGQSCKPTKGKMHIHNPITGVGKLIDPMKFEEYELEGYIRGRSKSIKFHGWPLCNK